MNAIDDSPQDRSPCDREVDTTCTDLLPANPFKPLDWRWQRALQLLAPKTRRRRWDDGGVVRAGSFCKVLARVHGDSRHPRLVRGHPEVLGAYNLRQGNPHDSSEIEARLLAGQSDEEIGDRIGVPPAVIDLYEQLFYEVRHRLGCPDWIMATAIGPRLYEGFDSGDHEVIGKLLAYLRGPHVLDAWLGSIAVGDRVAAPGLAEDLGLLVAVMATTVTAENAAGLIRIDALAGRIGRAEAAREVASATRPVVIPAFDVPIGPPTRPIAPAECSPAPSFCAGTGVAEAPCRLTAAG